MKRNTVNNNVQFGRPGRRSPEARSRTIERLSERPRILIVCEGEKTEPNYFRAFRVTNDVFGEGLETIRVVEEAERLNNADGPFNQIWCVFDRDSFPPDNFDNAVSKVRALASKGFRVAYSNEAFELWYILHFEYQDAALPRASYWPRLSAHIGHEYRKGDPDIYSVMQSHGNEELALRYALRLRDHHSENLPYSRRNPQTTVDELVKYLRGVQRERGF